MAWWHWLTGVVVVLVLAVALFGVHRLCLWLEDRGWLYYRKRPETSGGSGWIALQQFIEPGVKHVIQVQQVKRSEDDEEAGKGRFLKSLVASLDATPVNSPKRKEQGWTGGASTSRPSRFDNLGGTVLLPSHRRRKWHPKSDVASDEPI